MINDFILSIDIGSKNTKLVLGKKYGKKLTIKKCINIKTPENTFEDGNILDIKLITENIKKVLQTEGIKAKYGVCTIQSTSILLKEVYLPVVSKSNLNKILKYEINQQMNISLKDYSIDYKILDKVMLDGKCKYKVLVVAVLKSIIKNYLDLLNELKLKPLALDTHFNCILKIFSDREFKDKSVAVIDMGYNFFNVVILCNNKYEFSYMIKSVVKDINLLNDQNENLQNYIEKWSEDILRVFRYYIYKKAENKIDCVFIHGGYSQVENIDHYMENTLDLPVYKENLDNMFYLNALGALIRK
ncbi:type IV pilus assembly protein PilM [Alkalithermobacter thermoalcaliphilus JW-YL-7 = DSM 7308]|uniref:Type IV pilus assembly protein PilM n=1 Tax=Alkalithermobacter thermoalcaliphilus JW-YL-7 = DSM 7308 TaxID=1121328 RepID=A0A150FRX6_CLOPD|nr:type IV pilus assembly protein PilM [[Clostridium] paradoxum JW-YL-7 = DSM 7308]SHK36944.1 type IV pilus assembly protein PilM [[Clostridium] paradoxum JW-YL-7 = DSM 7308]